MRMKETLVINLDLLLKIKANPEEIEKFNKRELKKIFEYIFEIEGGDFDSGCSKEEHAEQLRWYLASEEFVDAKSYYEELDAK
jgi:hypothetical protein